MGTSADRSSGSGGAWTPLKHAANSYVRGIGTASSSDRARRVLARHVPLLGGVGGATSSAHAGSTGIQRLGELLSGLGSAGLDQALESMGLGSLVGQDRFAILDELVTFIAGDGDDLDSQAARDAACDVLDEMFADADTWAELAETTVTAEQLISMLEQFLTLYVYNRVAVVAERLSRLTNPTAARQADQEMRQIIGDFVALHMPPHPFSVDWSGPDGKAIAENAIASVYIALDGLEGGGVE